MFLRTALIVILAILNFALLGKVLWGQTGIIEYKNLNQQLQDLRAKVKQLDADNLQISNEIRLLQTDSGYVEKVIRQQLHYLRDNEVVYIFASADKKNLGVKNERKN